MCETCEFQSILKRIMTDLENLPEPRSKLYNNATSQVYGTAAGIAYQLRWHACYENTVQTDDLPPSSQKRHQSMSPNLAAQQARLEDSRTAEMFKFVQGWSKNTHKQTLPWAIPHNMVAELVDAAYEAGLKPHLEISYPTGTLNALIPLARIRFEGKCDLEPIVIERLADENGALKTSALQERVQGFLDLTTGKVEIPGMTFTLDSWLSPYLSDDLNALVLESVWLRGNVKII